MALQASLWQTATLFGVTAVLVGLAVAVSLPTVVAADPLEEMDGEGTEDDPYVVTTVDQLEAMNEDLDAHYVLGNDIDASDTLDRNAGQGLEPIGNGGLFTGSFDGQGHTIEDLYISRGENVGLFSRIEDATIENVELDSPTVRGGGTSVGSLVGEAEGGTIKNVSVFDAEVATGDTFAGGLVGNNRDPVSISDSVVTGSVEAVNQAGGLVGSASAGSIERSYVAGSVEAESRAAGLVVSGSDGLEIVASGADVSVEKSGMGSNLDSTGGLVARLGNFQDITISQSYVTGEVTNLEDDDDRIGTGGIGGAIEDANVVNSYAAADVDGQSGDVGGFAGELDGAVGSYWDVDASGQDVGVGDGRASATGLSTDEMTGPTARDRMSLSFGNTWLATNEYPVHEAHVESLSVVLTDDVVAVGNATEAVITLEMVDGSSIPVTETADVELDTDIATYEDGTIQTADTGETEVTVTLGEFEDTATLQSLTPPDVSLLDASLAADGALVGTTGEVTLDLENAGGMHGTFETTLSVDDETVAEPTITIPGDSEISEPVEWTVTEPGTYDIALDEQELGTLTVVERDAVELTGVDAPAEVDAGEEYTVEATIQNDADVAVPVTVEHADEERDVVVEPGTATVAFDRTAGEHGEATTHEVTVLQTTLDATTEVRTEQEADGDDGTADGADDGMTDDDADDDADDGVDDSDDGFGPGFAVGAAVLAVAFVALLARRRG